MRTADEYEQEIEQLTNRLDAARKLHHKSEKAKRKAEVAASKLQSALEFHAQKFANLEQQNKTYEERFANMEKMMQALTVPGYPGMPMPAGALGRPVSVPPEVPRMAGPSGLVDQLTEVTPADYSMQTPNRSNLHSPDNPLARKQDFSPSAEPPSKKTATSYDAADATMEPPGAAEPAVDKDESLKASGTEETEQW